MTSGIHTWDASMVQDSQINQCDTSYQQEKTQEPYDTLNRCRKAFDKIQHPFLIKTLQSIEIEGTFLNLIKTIYEKPTAISFSMGKSWKPFH